MAQHWRDLDGLRGVLAMYVVFLHFGISAFAQRTLGWPPMPLGLAVDVFFILSGFVLTHSTRHRVNFGDFAIKRLFRLVPVYYVVTLPTLLVVPTLPTHLWLDGLVAAPFAGRDPIVYPAWSICFELYLPLFAVLVPFRVPQRWVGFSLSLALIGLGACDYLVVQGSSLYAWRAALGLLAGHFLYRLDPAFKIDFGLAGLLVAAAIPLAGFFKPLAAIIPALACLAVVSGTRQSWLFSLPIVQWLGSISYTVYMAHIPVLYAMIHLGGDAFNQNPVAKLVGVLISIVCAYFLTVMIERPAMLLSKEILARRSRGARP